MPLSRRALEDASCRVEPHSFEMTLSATQMQVRDALKAVSRQTARWNLSAEAQSSVEIVLAEALNNVVEHAYAGIAGGTIAIDCAYDGDGLSIVITDQGHPVPETLFKNTKTQVHSIDPQNLPEGGFGWGLIRELTHDVQVSRIGNTTMLSLVINAE